MISEGINHCRRCRDLFPLLLARSDRPDNEVFYIPADPPKQTYQLMEKGGGVGCSMSANGVNFIGRGEGRWGMRRKWDCGAGAPPWRDKDEDPRPNPPPLERVEEGG